MHIHPITARDIPNLETFLYHAVFVPAGMTAPPFNIVCDPALQVYTAGFGERAHDMGAAAQVNGRTVGMCWARIMNDYGHADDETPSLAISVLPAFRGQGIGTALLSAVLAQLRQAGCRQVSLSVQKENPALRLYRRFGFETLRETQEEYIMVRALQEGEGV